jgi:selenocysteine lyase/cysteine desulfurase
MNSRRTFLRNVGTVALSSLPFTVFKNSFDVGSFLEKIKSASSDTSDEDFWGMIRQAFAVSPTIIDLNNAGVSPQNSKVQEQQWNYIQMSNEAPSYFMWRILDQGREPLRQKLADLGGCSNEEIAINRNATEAIETVIFGLNLKAGDEVILTKQDYPNMIHAWQQREKRDGIKLVWLNFDLPQESDEYFVNQFANAITDKTRVVHITHLINWMGQIQPVKKIAAAVRNKKSDVEVLIDGAQTFAHFSFNIPDLGGDYFGTSLHKWLCAPFGTGMLWVKKEKIASVWPLFANGNPDIDDIRKFEAQGTRSFPAEEAIATAVDFHNMIGSERKETRLRFLKNYWAEKVKDIPKIQLHTSLKPEYSCAICGVSIDGIDVSDLDNFLFNKYKIHTVGIKWENINCVRISPNVYTSTGELDKLVSALNDAAKNGVK